jgi:hypothetical protein
MSSQTLYRTQMNIAFRKALGSQKSIFVQLPNDIIMYIVKIATDGHKEDTKKFHMDRVLPSTITSDAVWTGSHNWEIRIICDELFNHGKLLKPSNLRFKYIKSAVKPWSYMTDEDLWYYRCSAANCPNSMEELD